MDGHPPPSWRKWRLGKGWGRGPGGRGDPDRGCQRLSGYRVLAEIQGPARSSVMARGYGPGVSKSEVGSKVPWGQGLAASAFSPERRGSNFWPGRARISQDWRAPSPAAMRTPQPSVLVKSSARPWNMGCPTAHRPRSQRQPPDAIALGGSRNRRSGPACPARPIVPPGCADCSVLRFARPERCHPIKGRHPTPRPMPERRHAWPCRPITSVAPHHACQLLRYHSRFPAPFSTGLKVIILPSQTALTNLRPPLRLSSHLSH